MNRSRNILDIAAELFYKKGFHGTSVDELGARAGLTGPAIYRHFSGKDEILATLFDEAMDELIRAAEPVDEDADCDFERLVRHHVEFAIRHRHLVNVTQREDRSLVDPWRRKVNRRRKLYVGCWEAAVARCLPRATPAEVAVATQTCLGTIFSIAYWPTKVSRTPGLADLIVRLTNEGLDAFRG
ncbi:TetR/AcrR family transcriptional regulator [Rhodococcus ruber]|uniref:TetR/AcrR family transcriptional regulator n=1 Tax=Rhodococcus TaxID=1827 RepID=UPI000C79FAC4|nr:MULTISPECIES: TetR/AcrR family transcriptional regulator [Rhodococcus]AUM16598.1 TetR/AcrR family transcriptional regulator [Rhodococcus ruber]MBD8052167.1 TetR/AcrR family transcriptional regulator [Rhodococcus ruber]